MTRTSMLWRVAAALFILINAAGAVYALAMGEPMHAGVHVALLVVGFAGWRGGQWRRRRGQAAAQLPDVRLDYLQQSVEAVALEVERIGEAQRYSDKLRAEKDEPPSPKKPPSGVE